MEAFAYFIPTKEHNGHEGGFQEKRDNTFNGQRGTENIPHEPRVVWPVCPELEFQN